MDAAPDSMPWLLRRLVELRTIDSDGAAALVRGGIVTLGDLHTAFEDGRIRNQFSGLDADLRRAAAIIAHEHPRQPLGRAIDFTDALILLIAAACPEVTGLVAAGDVRRFEPIVETLVIVGAAPDSPATL
jgi:hypothetical protein